MQSQPDQQVKAVHLERCPQCEYSLQGLSDAGRCPECGFTYDGQTFILRGIARGMSTTPISRKLLWIMVAIGGTLGPQLLIGSRIFGVMGYSVSALLGFAWLVGVIYLIATRRRRGEHRGIEPFVFAMGGFGSCAAENPTAPIDGRITSWTIANTVLLERKSRTWHRLRIGYTPPGSTTIIVYLDAGVYCHENEAPRIQAILQQRIIDASDIPTNQPPTITPPPHQQGCTAHHQNPEPE